MEAPGLKAGAHHTGRLPKYIIQQTTDSWNFSSLTVRSNIPQSGTVVAPFEELKLRASDALLAKFDWPKDIIY